MREMYARGYASESRVEGVEVDIEATVGIQIREDDDVDELTNYARQLAKRGLSWGYGNHVAVVGYIENTLATDYPDRAYFIETEEAGKGVQVFDPRDFVKERCVCPCITQGAEVAPRVEADPNQLEFQFDAEG